jgi:hypothetical protein
MKKNLPATRFSAILLLVVLLIAGPAFLSMAQPAWTSARELRISRSEIEQLFQKKKNDQTRVVFRSGTLSETVNLQVLNNTNSGDVSGAVACRIALDKGEAKLLISRKMLGGKQVYRISILPDPKSAVGPFKLKEEGKTEFVLEPAERSDIVTD